MNKRNLFTLIVLLIAALPSFAQKCQSGDITDIGERCIQNSLDKLSSKPIIINKLKHSYLSFEADDGSRGIINFYAVKAGKKLKECTLYYKAKNFSTNEIFENTVSIKHEGGFWGEKPFGISRLKNRNFIFKRSLKKNVCYIQPNGSKLAQFKKHNQFLLPEGNNLLFNFSFILTGLAIFVFAYSIFTDEDKFKAEQALDSDEDEKKEKAKDAGIVLKYSRPFFKRYLSPVVAGMKSKNKIKERYRRLLSAAGLTRYLSTEDFYAFKIFLILGFPLTFILVREFTEETWPLSLIPALSILGFYYPNIWAKGLVQRRGKEIIQNMPFMVDMLALSVEAGLDFMAAITRVVEKAPESALTDEFEILLREVKVGASRAEALRNLAWRIDSTVMSSFCATLIAADSVGASIGPILKALSQDIRQKRSADAEKLGAQAATKILFPMMLLVLPAVAIMIFIPFIEGFTS